MMHEIHYLVPTACGNKKEHVLSVNSVQELNVVVNLCKKFGYMMIRNPLCMTCEKLGDACDGGVDWKQDKCDDWEAISPFASWERVKAKEM